MKFYERLEIRDSIAYLRICANMDDDLALMRIINTPKRGIGDAAIASINDMAKSERISFFLAIKSALAKDLVKGKAANSLRILVAQIEKFNSEIALSPLTQIARDILTQSSYISMWQSENSLEAQGRIENIEEFIGSLSDFNNITEFLEYASLVESRDDANKQDAVTVMTVHAAKGLEFDLVFIPGLEDGIFPSGRSVEERNGLEEERRLMYVAITRAKKELVLSFAKTRYVFGNVQSQLPSRFLKELPREDIDSEDISFNGGFVPSKQQFSSVSTKKQSENHGAMKRVFHQKFGYGKVVNIDGNKLEIEFEKSGRKTVMKDFVTSA
jgi:DNA helicase-2/ATP-dependent DNA helicase PcrA